MGLPIHRECGDKGIVFHIRRLLADGQLLFLVNTSIESPSTGIIESDLAGIEQWDLYTGKIERFQFEKTPRGVKANFQLEPSGSLLLFLSRKQLQTAAPTEEAVSWIKPEAAP